MILSGDLTVRCSLCLSCLGAELNQTAVEVQRTGWMIEVEKVISSSYGMLNCLKAVSESTVSTLSDRVNVRRPLQVPGDCVFPRNLKVSVVGTALLRMRRRRSGSQWVFS